MSCPSNGNGNGYKSSHSLDTNKSVSYCCVRLDIILSNDPCAQSVSPMLITYTYPIVPCFQEWSFPHGSLPALWNTIRPYDNDTVRSTVDAVVVRDRSCRVTNNQIECDIAHLCPRSGITWFEFNDMQQYVSQQYRTTEAINDPANAVLLRSDIHPAFDKFQFVFVPKADGVLVTHVFSSVRELRNLYHNATLHQVGSGTQFLLARFALAIFPCLPAFIQSGQRRLLKLATEQTERWVDADECVDLSSNTLGRSKVAGKSKSASPAKHSRCDADIEYIDEVKENVVRRSEPKKTQDSRVDDSLSSTANPADDFKTLVQQWLESERIRSDPDGKWQTEMDWYKGILDNGGGLDSSELPRYLRIIGGDRIDDNEV